jgi:dTDP-4-amino-4,6-dideoxygalactose transaminase
MNVPLLDLVRQYRTIKHEIDPAIAETIETQRFKPGPAVATFEESVASYCGTKRAVGCASGTDALLLALMAWGVGEDGRRRQDQGGVRRSSSAGLQAEAA